MKIIIEGPDNAGKSTLADKLQGWLGWRIQKSEGPPKHPGEIEARIVRYLDMDDVIFDRFPAISDPIYNEAFGRQVIDRFDGRLVEQLYSQNPIIVYCDPGGRGLTNYRSNPLTESAEHLAALHRNYDKLLALYRNWAVTHAHFLYRIGDDDKKILQAITRQQGVRVYSF